MAVPFKPDDSMKITDKTKAKRATKPTASGERAAEVLRLLKGMSKHNAAKWHSRKELSELVGGPFNETRASFDTHRKAIARALESLRKAGSIEKGECGGFRYTAAFEVVDDSTDSDNQTLH